MSFFRTGKFRLLYLLALVQLVGGPLVLFQVSVFCKMVVNEAPQAGVAKAAAQVWLSEDFQAVLANAEATRANERKSSPNEKDPVLPKMEKAKDPVVPWMQARLNFAASSVYRKITDRERVWTPAWPQAPPGPPPRMV